MAYTSDLQYAESDESHRISVRVEGSTSTQSLPDLPGDDYSPNKGDLWKLNLETFFGFTGCITINDINHISILEGNNDGWNIDSIVTFVVDDQNNYELISADFDIFQWIDGDSTADERELTLYDEGQCIFFLHSYIDRLNIRQCKAQNTQLLPNICLY